MCAVCCSDTGDKGKPNFHKFLVKFIKFVLALRKGL